jgi:hypothetical protein
MGKKNYDSSYYAFGKDINDKNIIKYPFEFAKRSKFINIKRIDADKGIRKLTNSEAFEFENILNLVEILFDNELDDVKKSLNEQTKCLYAKFNPKTMTYYQEVSDLEYVDTKYFVVEPSKEILEKFLNFEQEEATTFIFGKYIDGAYNSLKKFEKVYVAISFYKDGTTKVKFYPFEVDKVLDPKHLVELLGQIFNDLGRPTSLVFSKYQFLEPLSKLLKELEINGEVFSYDEQTEQFEMNLYEKIYIASLMYSKEELHEKLSYIFKHFDEIRKYDGTNSDEELYQALVFNLDKVIEDYFSNMYSENLEYEEEQDTDKNLVS